MKQLTDLNPERMTCMEIWGGNFAIEKYFEAPGLDIYVHSTPFNDSQIGGGDIYYLTSCASGRISRFLLADVSGHGESASAIAVSLRDLLRQNVNKISQQQFVTRMNVEFTELSESNNFATAVVATFFEPKKSLEISVAGHPYPMYYSATTRQWICLDPAKLEKGLGNLPLGVYGESSYPGRKIDTTEDDMFLLYSDAFIESNDQADNMIGINGLLNILNEPDRLSPAEVIPFLRNKIGKMANDNLTNDDATMILGHFTSTKVRFRDNLLAPFRLLRDVCDNTRLDS